MIQKLFLKSIAMILTCCSMCSIAGTSQASPATNADTQKSYVTRLPNGLTVVVKEDDRFPLVSMRLLVRAGSAYETDSEAGLSHILEHMAFKGTEKRPKGTISADVEKTGGNFNAYTSFDRTVYLVDMTKDHWKEGLDILKDMTSSPLLEPEELESEKEVILSELKMNRDKPARRIFQMVQTSIFKDGSYRHPIIGTEDTIRGATPETLRRYISRYYQPQSMVLVVYGNIQKDEIVAEAAKCFGDMRNTVNVEAPVSESIPIRGFTVLKDTGPWQKATLGIALPGAPASDIKSAQLDLLAQILGGDPAARFPLTYKYHRQLVDSIDVYNYSMERGGVFFISVTLDVDKIAPFWEAFSHELGTLHETTFSVEELNRAKLNIRNDLYRYKETFAGCAESLLSEQFVGGNDYEANYLRVLDETSQHTLSRLIDKNFSPTNLYFAALLPENAEFAESEDFSAWAKDVLEKNWKENTSVNDEQKVQPVSGIEDIDLGQGRRLILQYDGSLPFVSANLVFSGGNLLLNENNQGLGNFTASLMSKGTKTRSATDYDEYLSDRASAINITNGVQSFSFKLSAPSEYSDDIFTLLQETMEQPSMLDEEAERVRKTQLSDIIKTEDDAFGLVRRRMYPFLIGSSHPYAFTALGDSGKVTGFTAKDASSFWNKQKKMPWVLSVCGTFDREAIIEAAKKLPIPSENSLAVPDVNWTTNHVLDLELKGRNQAHLFMVFPTVPMGHEDRPALDVLEASLAGMSGLLFRDLRDVHGLGYTVTAYPWKSQKSGALILYIGTDKDKMEEAQKGFERIIADLHENPLSLEDIDRGKNVMLGDYYRSQQKTRARADSVAVLAALGLPLDLEKETVEKAQAINAETLTEIARRYLDVEKAYLIRVMP